MLKYLARPSGLAVGIVLAGTMLAMAQTPKYQWINAAPYVAAEQDSVYFCENGTFIGDIFGFSRATHFRGAEGFFGPGSPGTKTMAASTTKDCANVVATVEIDVDYTQPFFRRIFPHHRVGPGNTRGVHQRVNLSECGQR